MLSKNIDEKVIQDLFGKGYSNSQVAKELGIAPATVSYWKKKLKVPLDSIKHDWKAIQAHYDEGLSYTGLAEKVGVSKRSLQKARDRGDFKPRQQTKMDPNIRKQRVKVQRREGWMRYTSRKKYQTPADENIKALQEFYANCPEGYEVDHIIPISKGGKHSLSNLQYLTKEENRRKSNKIIRE
jgi:5-methylcytosine-specific restriction endonuclease McrA